MARSPVIISCDICGSKDDVNPRISIECDRKGFPRWYGFLITECHLPGDVNLERDICKQCINKAIIEYVEALGK